MAFVFAFLVVIPEEDLLLSLFLLLPFWMSSRVGNLLSQFSFGCKIVRTMTIYVATSNPGKLRDFAAATSPHITLAPLPGINEIPAPPEDEPTFEGNARLKAIYYSHHAPGQIVIADDSGLEVDALDGAPGVRSARYADDNHFPVSISATTDERNNLYLLEALSRSSHSRSRPPATTASSPPPVTESPRHRRRHRRRRNPHHPARHRRLRLRSSLLSPRPTQDHGRARHPNQAHLQPPRPSLRRPPQSPPSAPPTHANSITLNLIAQTIR